MSQKTLIFFFVLEKYYYTKIESFFHKTHDGMEYLLNKISSVEDEEALEKVEIEETNNLRSIEDGVL